MGTRPALAGTLDRLANHQACTTQLQGSASLEPDLVGEALKQGLLINVTSDKVVRLLPPLIMKRSEAEQVVNLLSGIIREFLAA